MFINVYVNRNIYKHKSVKLAVLSSWIPHQGQ